MTTCAHCGAEVGCLTPGTGLENLCPRCVLERVVADLPTGHAAARTDQELVGRRIGNYEITGWIGGGGMGTVFRARQAGLDREVALKVLKSDDEGNLQLFLREARVIARLRHPNIVTIYEVSTQEGVYFYTMELVQGDTLAQRTAQGPLEPAYMANLMAKVADAVHYAHEHGVIHRDLKPGNILLDEQGEPRVADFGLAKDLRATLQLTASGTIMGTPAYMAPEQAEGHIGKIGPHTDVYAMGAVLYEGVIGHPPYVGANIPAVLLQICDPARRPVPPCGIRKAIPEELGKVCLKALEKSPHLRYASAREFAEALRKSLRADLGVAQDISSEAPRTRLGRLKRFAPWMAVASLAVVGAIGLVAYFMVGHEPTPHPPPPSADPGVLRKTNAPPLQGKRALHVAALLPGERMLVAGGFDGTDLATCEIYDPGPGGFEQEASGSWAPTAPLLFPRRGHTGTALPDGRVLVVGGTSGAPGTDMASCEIYGPATGTWIAGAPLGQARHSHTATLLDDGRVLIAGGICDDSVSACEIYDPSLDSWTATGPLLRGRYYHTATLLLDGKVLVVGGAVTPSGNLATCEIYDPEFGGWSPTGTLEVARGAHTAALLPDGMVLVAGGECGGPLTACELYDPATARWSSTAPLNHPRDHHTATLLLDGRVLVVGGDISGPSIRDCEVYDPAAGSWSLTGSMGLARQQHTATLLQNGRVLVVGGEAGGMSYLLSCEIYTPGASAGPR